MGAKHAALPNYFSAQKCALEMPELVALKVTVQSFRCFSSIVVDESFTQLPLVVLPFNHSAAPVEALSIIRSFLLSELARLGFYSYGNQGSCTQIPAVSQFEFLSQSVGRVARLSGNVRQPNQVIDD